MNQPNRDLQDGQQGSGSVNTVHREGNTVRRPAGPWTPAVHELLRHLEAARFTRAQRALGIDAAQGLEIISYLEGQVAMRPWPDDFAAETGIAAAAEWLREYHQAVKTYQPRPGSQWRAPDAPDWQPGMIVRHGDLGPWNMVWNAGRLAGFIDWDLAEPGTVMEDIAQLAWYCIPLTALQHSGIDLPARAARLNVLCQTLRVTPADVLQSLRALMRKEARRVIELSRAGLEPWLSFAKRGDLETIAADAQWVDEAFRPR